jgi:hypothetical protein
MLYPTTWSLEPDGAAHVKLTEYDAPVPVRPIPIVLFDVALLVMVSWPETAPDDFGSNCRLIVAVWPACNVRGDVAPETAKPVPVIEIALTTTAPVPVDVSVIDWVAGELSATLPNATLVALALNARAGADDNCRAKPPDAPPAVAVNVTVSAVVTAATVALKLALVALAGTVTDAGTVTARVLLARLTANPPEGAAAVRLTVHASVPEPVILLLEQESVLRAGGGVIDGGAAIAAALKFTTTSPWDELLEIVRAPA